MADNKLLFHFVVVKIENNFTLLISAVICSKAA